MSPVAVPDPHTPQPLFATLFAMGDMRDWQIGVSQAATVQGLRTHRMGPSVAVWDPALVGVMRSGVSYCDGWKIHRNDLGRRRGALAVLPHRVYFEPGSATPSRLTERDLVGGPLPRNQTFEHVVLGCREVVGRIAEAFPEIDAKFLQLESCRFDIHRKTAVRAGSDSVLDARTSLAAFIRRNGFRANPVEPRICAVAPDGQTDVVRDHMRILEETASELHLPLPRVRVVRREVLDRRLDEIERGDPVGGSPVVLFAVPGDQGVALGEPLMRAQERLDSAGVRYRMYTIDHRFDRLKAASLLTSIVLAAGGRPWELAPPWQRAERPVLVGVDLGHPLAERHSWLAITLCDELGMALGMWRGLQARDETARPETLEVGLAWLRRTLREHGLDRHEIVVLRDGRRNPAETVGHYRKALGRSLTYIEIAKKDNPLIFHDPERPRWAAVGSVGVPPGGDVRFLMPMHPLLRTQTPHALKIRYSPATDELVLGPDALVDLIAGLCLAPSLGLAPHQAPGPIYWSDGIASISATNRQFAGLGHHEYIPNKA